MWCKVKALRKVWWGERGWGGGEGAGANDHRWGGGGKEEEEEETPQGRGRIKENERGGRQKICSGMLRQ